MHRAPPHNHANRDAWLAGLIFILPSALVILDILLKTDLIAALWKMTPMALAGVLAVIGLSLASGGLAGSGVWIAEAGPAARFMQRAALALFAVAVVLGGLRAVHPLYSLIKLGELALFALAAVVLAGKLRIADPSIAARLLRALFAGTVVSVLVLGLVRWLGLSGGDSDLAMPGYVHIRIFGFALALAIAAGFGLWTDADRRDRALLGAGLVILWVALFWSGGRGGVAALLVSLPAVALVAGRGWRALGAVCAAAAAGFALSLLIPTSAAELGLSGRIAGTAAATSADALSSGRLEMWRTLADAVNAAPLLGRGYAQSHWVFAAAGFRVAHLHAHNIVLDAALALGWAGAAALAAITAAAWARWARRARRTDAAELLSAFALVTVFLVFSLVDGLYFYHHAMLPLAVAVAVLSARSGAPSQADPASRT